MKLSTRLYFRLRGRTYRGSSLAELSATYSRLRDDSGEGQSTWPFPDVYDEGQSVDEDLLVGRLSYNGKVWDKYDGLLYTPY